MRRHGRGWAGLVTAVILVVAAACGTSEDQGTSTQSDPRAGISDSEIRIGGVVGEPNPIGRPYGSGFEGAKAYFDYVNGLGGVFGREINQVSEREDATQTSRHQAQVRALVEEDDVFAVLPIVTNNFAASEYLVEQGVPTFGWNINAEWSDGPNLFGEKGSFLCFTCADPFIPIVADQIGAEKVGILAYAVPQSEECAKGQKASYEKFGFDLVYENTSLSFGFSEPSIAADIDRIREEGVEFISTCIDVNGNATFNSALRSAGLDVALFAPEGYDPTVPPSLGEDVEGFYFATGFVPFEAAEDADSPGLDLFLSQMEKLGYEPNEQSLAGWINATLLVQGIIAAGPDFDRQKVIDAINGFENFTANGIYPDLNWKKQHDGPGDVDCVAYLQIQDGAFVPVFGEPGKPFLCNDPQPDSLEAANITPTAPALGEGEIDVEAELTSGVGSSGGSGG